MNLTKFLEKQTAYHSMNDIARPGGIVFFGSTYLTRFPLAELTQDFEVDLPVYNRSVEGLTMAEAEGMLETCVTELYPSKVFIALGDADVAKPDFDLARFLDDYQWLLYTLHNSCSATLYIMSVLSDAPAAAVLNERLRAMARETGCAYVDGVAALSGSQPIRRLFLALQSCMRTHPITFSQAMGM